MCASGLVDAYNLRPLLYPSLHCHAPFPLTIENNGIEESTEIDLASAALPKHAAAIRKRMNTLRSTIRSKHQRRENGAGGTHTREDVRNVFNSSGGLQPQDSSALVSM